MASPPVASRIPDPRHRVNGNLEKFFLSAPLFKRPHAARDPTFVVICALRPNAAGSRLRSAAGKGLRPGDLQFSAGHASRPPKPVPTQGLGIHLPEDGRAGTGARSVRRGAATRSRRYTGSARIRLSVLRDASGSRSATHLRPSPAI